MTRAHETRIIDLLNDAIRMMPLGTTQQCDWFNAAVLLKADLYESNIATATPDQAKQLEKGLLFTDGTPLLVYDLPKKIKKLKKIDQPVFGPQFGRQ